MRGFSFQLLNVFTLHGRRFSGNPLCVFEDGTHFSDGQMQAIARQFNLSETTFLLPPSSAQAVARVRIFTPTLEMPFAGHPTLGTAHVARSLWGGESFSLEMRAGLVAVQRTTEDGSDRWTLRTPRAPTVSELEASAEDLAACFGLEARSLALGARWVNAGTEQLVVPVRSPEDVTRASPDPARFSRHVRNATATEAAALLWAWVSPAEVVARFFFHTSQGIGEDPATGSACANLGGWLLSAGQPLPFRLSVRQGDATGRPSLLHLHVDAGGHIHVGGEVLEVGRGTFALDP
jgi:trans-2,3-dihydro-3-hydroxyanthranilate isomerase